VVHDRHPGHRHPLTPNHVAVAPRAHLAGTLATMNVLILASEVHTEPLGDDFAAAAYTMLGVVMLISAVVTWIITPKQSDHH